MTQSLLAGEITLRRLNRRGAEQELDRLQFSAAQIAESGATAAQNVRSELVDSGALRSFDHMQDRLRRDPLRPKACPPGSPAGK
jgi:hypothetical protein